MILNAMLIDSCSDIIEVPFFFGSLILEWCAWKMHKTVLYSWEPFLGCCMLMIQRQGKHFNSYAWLCITFIIMQTFYYSYYDNVVVLQGEVVGAAPPWCCLVSVLLWRWWLHVGQNICRPGWWYSCCHWGNLSVWLYILIM